VTLALALFVAAILILLFASDLAQLATYRDESHEYIATVTAKFRLFAGVAMIFAFGMITYLYASGFSLARLKKENNIEVGQSIDIQAIAQMIDSVRRSADKIAENRFITEKDKAVIGGNLEKIVRDSLPKEFLSKIDKKYGGAIQNEKVSIYVEEFMQKTRERLGSFQTDLSRKAASSLAWGLATAGIGLLALIFFIYMQSHEALDTVSAVFYITSRVGLIALIEIVAFFFLSQYRFTLQDEKYVNNELTNADVRLLTLVIAAKMGSKEAVDKVLIELSKTERNFILKKGETSVFHSGAGGDILKTAAAADVLARLLPGSGKFRQASE